MKRQTKKNSSTKFKKIATYNSHAEVEMMVDLLKQKGIQALIQSPTVAIFGPSSVTPPQGIDLLVPEKDFEKASKILPYKG